MYWIISVALVLTYLFLTRRLGPQTALAMVAPIAMALPVWVILAILPSHDGTIVGSGVDIKVLVTTVCVAAYCFLPGRTFPLKLVPCDFAMIGLLGSHLASDFSNDGFSWLVLGKAYAEWYLPYVAARVSVQSREDLLQAWPVIASVGIVLGFLASWEAILHSNLYEFFAGPRPMEGTTRDAARWGMKRAFGPTMHPIYFGVVQLLFLGWSLFAAALAVKRQAHKAWLLAPLLPVMGIIGTGSRGPILVMAVAVYAIAFFQLPRARWILGLSAVVILVALIANRNVLIEQLENLSGENRPRKTTIEVEGEELVHSGTRNRLNLFEVYEIAMRRSGFLGFGTEAVTGFPINVPVGPREASALKRTRYIDNEYVLLVLRFGYIGAGFFCLAGLCALGQFLFIAIRYEGDASQWLASCLGGCTLATMVVLLTVWMPHEIGFLLMWTWGVSSALVVADRYQVLEPVVENAYFEERPRLSRRNT